MTKWIKEKDTGIHTFEINDLKYIIEETHPRGFTRFEGFLERDGHELLCVDAKSLDAAKMKLFEATAALIVEITLFMHAAKAGALNDDRRGTHSGGSTP